MSAVRRILLMLIKEFDQKRKGGSITQRISYVEATVLLGFEDSIDLDWLRVRYGDYVALGRMNHEDEQITEAKLTVIKRLALALKEEIDREVIS